MPVAELGTDKPTRHWLGTVELGVDYAIVLTTCAGLWSYVIGDVVRFVDKTPPRLIITGRTSYMLSSFGEHCQWRADRNLRAGCGRAIGAQINEFSVGTQFPESGTGELGHHVYVVEFSEISDRARLAAFTDAIDRETCRAQRGLSGAWSSQAASARR